MASKTTPYSTHFPPPSTKPAATPSLAVTPPAAASASPASDKRKKRFTEEQQQNAVRLVDEAKYSIAAAAKAVGCSEPSLRGWHAKYGAKRVPCGADASYEALQAEVKTLRGQLRQAEMEREILKKATAYFASLKS
jgi:transposase